VVEDRQDKLNHCDLSELAQNQWTNVVLLHPHKIYGVHKLCAVAQNSLLVTLFVLIWISVLRDHPYGWAVKIWTFSYRPYESTSLGAL
jgi:hypothetical protein